MILLVLFHLGGGFVKAIPFPPIYLFFCVEGLSTLIKKVEIKGEICGIPFKSKKALSLGDILEFLLGWVEERRLPLIT